jgi:hypothetical protein
MSRLKKLFVGMSPVQMGGFVGMTPSKSGASLGCHLQNQGSLGCRHRASLECHHCVTKSSGCHMRGTTGSTVLMHTTFSFDFLLGPRRNYRNLVKCQ